MLKPDGNVAFFCPTGFAPQIRTLVMQTRPDRQTLLFSATWSESVQVLSAELLKNPVTVWDRSGGV